jgi:hypothetical protein
MFVVNECKKHLFQSDNTNAAYAAMFLLFACAHGGCYCLLRHLLLVNKADKWWKQAH